MNENEINKSVVTSYRLKEDAKNRIKKQLADLNMTQEEYFNKVVSVMELENVKQNNIFAVNATEIQELTQRLYNIFINLCDQGNSFLSNKDIELQELKQKYKDMLSDKENILQQQKEELQQVYAENNVLQNENEEHKIDLMKIKSDFIKQLEQLEGSIQDKNNLIEEYKGKNDMLLSQLKQYEKYPQDIEDLKQLLSDSKESKTILENDLISKTEENKRLATDINVLKEKNVQELDRVKEKHSEEINRIKQQAEFNNEKALLAKDKEYQDTLNKINAENNTKVKELLQENQEYNSKLSKLLEESQDKNIKMSEQADIIKSLMLEVEKLKAEIDKKDN